MNKKEQRRLDHLYELMVRDLILQGLRPKGSRKNNFPVYAPRCASDLAWAIERNRRRSPVYVEDFAIEARSKLSCRWDAKTGSYF